MDIPKETRRESHHAVLSGVEARQAVVLGILRERGGMTAQEIAAELHRRGHTPSDERNFAAPRLTELRDAGKVEAIGKKTCGKTGRSVTVWAAVKEVYHNPQSMNKTLDDRQSLMQSGFKGFCSRPEKIYKTQNEQNDFSLR